MAMLVLASATEEQVCILQAEATRNISIGY